MGIGSSVIRPLKDALDGMPVHVRQLSEMFRKHGQGHTRNRSDIADLDTTDVPDALRDGWRRDTDWTPDAVTSWKGDAPDPSEYLDADYIDQHLARFDDGASRIYFSDSLHKYGPGQADHSTFVFPRSELQQILDETGGDANQIADRLGIDRQWFFDANGDPVPVEIRHFEPSELTNLRVPNGNEAGANENWIPGGYLPTGVPEAVIDVPESATGTASDYNPGLWPGTAQSLTLH
ncbi:hypothetical protein [Microbacterium abyssi]|uniref:hypothetical protein n=1 Tax=Microbacterium abyssi TaxID=2782166 RepID=UPI001887EA15|nr:hypothetical protein [Microbacterium sp. A18JL241]